MGQPIFRKFQADCSMIVLESGEATMTLIGCFSAIFQCCLRDYILFICCDFHLKCDYIANLRLNEHDFSKLLGNYVNKFICIDFSSSNVVI